MRLWFCVPTRTKGCHFWIIITSFIKLTFSYTDLFSTLGATVYNLWPLFMEILQKEVFGNPVISFFLQRPKHGRKALKGPWMVSWSATTRWSRAWSLSTNIPSPKPHNRNQIPSLCVLNAYNEDGLLGKQPLVYHPVWDGLIIWGILCTNRIKLILDGKFASDRQSTYFNFNRWKSYWPLTVKYIRQIQFEPISIQYNI